MKKVSKVDQLLVFLGILSICLFPSIGKSQSPVSVDFINKSNTAVDLYWVNPQGGEQFFGRAEPNTTFRQQSYPTHTWRIKSGSNVLGEYEATGLASQKLEIDASGRVKLPSTASNPVPNTGTSTTSGTQVNFRTNAALNTPINLQTVNYPQLQMAIALVTNEVRARNGKSQLPISAHLANAAQMHANDMVQGKFFDHQNVKDSTKADPQLRAKMHGVANPVISENINQGFVLNYQAGSPVVPLGGGNFNTPEGKLLGSRTPLSLADSLLATWMNSPGHKQNILDDQAIAIGCGIALFYNSDFHQMPTAYAVQKFQRQQAIQVLPGF